MSPFSNQDNSPKLRPSPAQKYSYPQKKSKYQVKIPHHFQKNYIITYSETEINQELNKYPGLLKTLGHAYQYQIIFNNETEKMKEYWFCRNLQVTMPLLKYLNDQGWQVDWQEKPFSL